MTRPIDAIQDAVSDWHTDTFGLSDDPARVVRTAKKLLEEAAEAYCAASSGDERGLRKEICDVAIVCYSLAQMTDCQLDDEIRGRLVELRKRTDQRQRDYERGI